MKNFLDKSPKLGFRMTLLDVMRQKEAARRALEEEKRLQEELAQAKFAWNQQLSYLQTQTSPAQWAASNLPPVYTTGTAGTLWGPETYTTTTGTTIPPGYSGITVNGQTYYQPNFADLPPISAKEIAMNEVWKRELQRQDFKNFLNRRAFFRVPEEELDLPFE